ncbi:MAG: hypothetical protein EBT15_09075 [Betaproteobacteria bacterium]|nr:hypothetical protein [Betaproteobacteria bacterium]
MDHASTLYEWQSVPERVATLLPLALRLKAAHEKAATQAHVLATTAATWLPDVNSIALYTPVTLTKEAFDAYAADMHAAGIDNVSAIQLSGTEVDPDAEIVIKQGSLVPGLAPVWNASNKLLGGPTPLSNGIVAGLLAGGLGYGAGTLVEQFFPARYLQRGKLRRTLGMIGALGGAGLAGLNSYANARAMRTSTLKGLFTNNKTPVVYPYEEKMEKDSSAPMGGATGAFLNEPMFSPTVSVPQFNQAAWQDVNMGMYRGFQQHTPPQFAAAATGLMSGISTNMNSPIIRPIDVVRGIASAGVGLATATVAGKTLAALAGLTPEGQNKLQEMGLWGGMMHAVVPSLFGR